MIRPDRSRPKKCRREKFKTSRAGCPNPSDNLPEGKLISSRRLLTHSNFARPFRSGLRCGRIAVDLLLIHFTDEQMRRGSKLVFGLQPVILVAPVRAAIPLPVQVGKAGNFIVVWRKSFVRGHCGSG